MEIFSDKRRLYNFFTAKHISNIPEKQERSLIGFAVNFSLYIFLKFFLEDTSEFMDPSLAWCQ